jgi:hypothetical protein
MPGQQPAPAGRGHVSNDGREAAGREMAAWVCAKFLGPACTRQAVRCHGSGRAGGTTNKGDVACGDF